MFKYLTLFSFLWNLVVFLTVNTSAKHIRLKLSPALCSAPQPRFPPQAPQRGKKKAGKLQQRQNRGAAKFLGFFLWQEWHFHGHGGMATPVLLPVPVNLGPGNSFGREGSGAGVPAVSAPRLKNAELLPKKKVLDPPCLGASGLSPRPPRHPQGSEKGVYLGVDGVYSHLSFSSLFSVSS